MCRAEYRAARHMAPLSLRADVLALAVAFACGAMPPVVRAQATSDPVAPAKAGVQSDVPASNVQQQPDLPPLPLVPAGTMSGAPYEGPRISARTLQNMAVGEIVVDVTPAPLSPTACQLLVTSGPNDARTARR